MRGKKAKRSPANLTLDFAANIRILSYGTNFLKEAIDGTQKQFLSFSAASQLLRGADEDPLAGIRKDSSNMLVVSTRVAKANTAARTKGRKVKHEIGHCTPPPGVLPAG